MHLVFQSPSIAFNVHSIAKIICRPFKIPIQLHNISSWSLKGNINPERENYSGEKYSTAQNFRNERNFRKLLNVSNVLNEWSSKQTETNTLYSVQT